MNELVTSGEDPSQDGPRRLSRTACLALLLAAALVLGGWVAQLANMPTE